MQFYAPIPLLTRVLSIPLGSIREPARTLCAGTRVPPVPDCRMGQTPPLPACRFPAPPLVPGVRPPRDPSDPPAAPATSEARASSAGSASASWSSAPCSPSRDCRHPPGVAQGAPESPRPLHRAPRARSPVPPRVRPGAHVVPDRSMPRGAGGRRRSAAQGPSWVDPGGGRVPRPRDEKVVALTFDDGWGGRTHPRRSSASSGQKHVNATFFPVGQAVRHDPDDLAKDRRGRLPDRRPHVRPRHPRRASATRHSAWSSLAPNAPTRRCST